MLFQRSKLQLIGSLEFSFFIFWFYIFCVYLGKRKYCCWIHLVIYQVITDIHIAHTHTHTHINYARARKKWMKWVEKKSRNMQDFLKMLFSYAHIGKWSRNDKFWWLMLLKRLATFHTSLYNIPFNNEWV